MGKKIEHIDFSIHSTSSFNNIFEFDKSEFAVIYADDGISGTNTKNVRTLTLLCISFQKRNSRKNYKHSFFC